MVRLRPHHLLCILTYAGKGYSPAFVDCFDRIAARIRSGEPVMIVAGPDDVCAPLAHDPDRHCDGESVLRRDAAAAAAVEPLLGPLPPGASFSLAPDRLNALRAAFAAGAVRAACTGCEWSDLCGRIAADGYAGTRLAD